ncbi:MAG: hypothetical protein ACYDH9_16775 [Limisphaerales bacterium]
MYPSVDTRHPSEVELEVQRAYRAMFPGGDRYLVSQAFDWAVECFGGRYRDYQAIDARYHDFEHTLQGTLCMARLLHGRHRAAAQPVLTQRMFEVGVLAILLHDTGYLKKRDDTEGTGAKYTLIHVSRSAEFADQLLSEKGFSHAEITTVQHMIRCTGVNVDLDSIPFPGELERTVGYALGTADLLGQMAAEDYIPKLPVLYSEFAESSRYNAGQMTSVGGFASAEDLMQKTPGFWEKFVLPKINQSFRGLYQFLNFPYPDGPNYYLTRIEANMERLRQQLAASTAVAC